MRSFLINYTFLTCFEMTIKRLHNDLTTVLSGDAEKILGPVNCFVNIARKAVFECVVYI